MTVLEIPCDWVAENGIQADGDVFGGTTALSTNDGLTSYTEGYVNASTIGSAYFRFTFPPTALPADAVISAVELVTVGQRTPGTMSPFTVRCGVGHRDDTVTLVNSTVDGSDSVPTATQFPAAPTWGTIVLPLAGSWANTIAGGTNSTGRLGDLFLEGCRLTYLALRVTYGVSTGTLHVPPLRLFPRSDGRGMSSAARVWPRPPTAGYGRVGPGSLV